MEKEQVIVKAAKAIYIDKRRGRLLVVNSKKNFFPGKLDIPGGRIEDEEVLDPSQTIRREAAEEFGLSTEKAAQLVIKFLDIQTPDLNTMFENDPKRQNLRDWIVMFYFFVVTGVTVKDELVLDTGELESYEWLSFDEVPAAIADGRLMPVIGERVRRFLKAEGLLNR